MKAKLLALILGLFGFSEPGDVVPPVSLRDLDRFPSEAVASRHVAFSMSHIEWVEMQGQLNPRDDWTPWLWEAKMLHGAWEDLWWAADESVTDEIRLSRLSRLRDRLGLRAYFRGEMPPCVPLWRFRSLP